MTSSAKNDDYERGKYASDGNDEGGREKSRKPYVNYGE